MSEQIGSSFNLEIPRLVYAKSFDGAGMKTFLGDIKEGQWFIEDNWEVEDPLWRAALQLKPSIYVEDLEEAAKKGILNLDFERNYMFHTALIHGHAHWPPLNVDAVEERRFYGSVQPAVFDGPRVWSTDAHELVEKCLARIAPIMKAYGENAPPRSSFEGLYFRGVLDTSGVTGIQS